MLGPSRRQLLRIIERERAQHDEMIRELLDRLAHAYERPWTLPPVSTPTGHDTVDDDSDLVSPLEMLPEELD